MEGADPTISATEFARLTGLSRERLRTWERRHGFPVPVRSGAGRRRYALADAAPLIAARRAADAGVPVAAALTQARAAAQGAEVTTDVLVRAFEEAPLESLVVSGPSPVTVLYANRAAREAHGTPVVGDDIDGEPGDRIAAAFAASGPSRFERLPWQPGDVAAPCLAVPLQSAEAAAPLLVLYELEPAGSRTERAAARAVEEHLEETSDELAERETALALADEVVELLRDRPGVAAITASADLLLRRLDIVDVAVAPYMTGQIVLGRSSRGLLGPDMVTVAAHRQLADAVRDGEIAALAPPDAAALGAPEGLGALIVPAICAGEALAVLVLLFDDTPVVGDGLLRTLRLIATTLGLALMQERFLGDEPELRRPER